MTPDLNWCGWPIGPGESYYGGKPAAKKHQHYAVITEGDLAEVFGNGLRKLTRVEAAKLLEELTGAPPTFVLSRFKTQRKVCPASAQ